MSGNTLTLHEARVRQFDPVTKVATVVMPGAYGMEPIEALPFVRSQVNSAVIPNLFVGDRVLVTMNENESPEWTSAFADNGPLAAWPVGSVFITVVVTNPAVLLGGGTWVQFAQGRTIIGQWGSDAEFNAPEEIGGAKTVTLTEANLASHDHTMAHTHEHNHTHANSHSHTFSDTASSTSLAGSHAHPIDVRQDPVSGSAGYIALSNAGGTLSSRSTDTVAHHSHTVAVSGTTSDASSGTEGPSTTTTGGSSAPNTGLAGSATPVNKMPPFIVVYMWKRVS